MDKKVIYKALLLGLLFTVIFFFPLILNINKPIVNGGDESLVSFIISKTVSSLLKGNFDISTLPMFYGFENSLFYSETFLPQIIIAVPIYALVGDAITSFNLLILLTFILSFTSMYLLVNYFTKNTLASCIGALIFVFNPFVLNHFPDRLQVYTLMFIPLVFLFFEKYIREKKEIFAFLVFLTLTIQLFASVYYFVFTVIIFSVYAIVRLRQEKVKLKKLITREAVIGFLILISSIFILGNIYQDVFKYTAGRDIAEDMTEMSPWLSDYLFTNQNNYIYGDLRQSVKEFLPNLIRFSPNFNQNLFIGIIPLVLLISSYFLVRKSTFSKIYVAFLVVLFLGFILSFGPHVFIAESTNMPNLYDLLRALIPVVNQTRDPARFAVFVFLAIGIISALSVTKIKSISKFPIIGILLLVLMAGEYMGSIPSFRQFSHDEKNFYQAINSDKDIKVIVELPMGEEFIARSDGEILYNNIESKYLLYTTAFHDKKLINGYSGFEPDKYLYRVSFLRSELPTDFKIRSLKTWGADAVVLHKDLLGNSEYSSMINEVEKLGYKRVLQSGNLTLVKLKK